MPAKLSELTLVIQSLLKSIIGLVGAAFLVMLVIGGFKYIMAGGNKEAVSKAQNTLTYAFIGLIVTLSSFIILNLVSNFLGIPNIGKFRICITDPC